MEYTRDLGFLAAEYLLQGGSGAMMTLQEGHFRPVRFGDMLDPETGRTRVRQVDITSEQYKIARRYMVRLRREDFEDAAELERLAEVARVSPEEFKRQFGYLIEQEPQPMRLLTQARGSAAA
jgi:6-phosphofructokinase 1